MGGCCTPVEVQVGVCGAWVAVSHQKRCRSGCVVHGWLWHTGRGAGQGVWCVGGCGTPVEVQVGVCGAWVAVARL